jgi:hypothetical protein
MDTGISFRKEDEPDVANRFQLSQHPNNRLKGHLCCGRHRTPEGTGRDRRKSDRDDLMLIGEMQSTPVTVGEQSLRLSIEPVNWPEAMDDMAVWKLISAGNDRFARPDRRKVSASAIQLQTGRAVDGASDAATHAQLGVGGVDDSLDVWLPRDVALNALQDYPSQIPLWHEHCLSSRL